MSTDWCYYHFTDGQTEARGLSNGATPLSTSRRGAGHSLTRAPGGQLAFSHWDES